MNPGKQADLGGQRPHLVHGPAVHTLLLVQQPAADYVLLGFIHALVDLGLALGIDRVEMLMNLFINGL